MRKAVPILAAAAALVSPSLARAGDVAMRVQDVPLGSRSLAAIAGSDALQHARAALARARHRPLSHAPPARQVVELGRGGRRRGSRRRHRPLARRQPRVDGRVRRLPVPPGRRRAAVARVRALVARDDARLAAPRPGGAALDRAARRAGMPTRRSSARSRGSRRSSGSPSSITRPARTRTRPRRRRRSCAASRSTTCRETAGTTSATTFSSTASAPCTRAGAGGSTRT